MPLGTDDHRGGGVVLRREDVARAPAHLGAERDERLDEDRGLDGHVQRARDARALERLGVGVLGAGGHQAGHLVLGQADLLAAELGQGQVGDLEVGLGQDGGAGGHGLSVVAEGVGAAATSSRWCLSCSQLSQSCGRDVLRAGRRGLEPVLDGLAQLGVAAQAQREADVREADLEALQQLAQGAQALELLGAEEPVAGGRAAGLDEAGALDVAQHAGRPAGGLRCLVDGEGLRHCGPYLTTGVSRF